MPKIYPQSVSASIIKLVFGENEFYLRQWADIHFGHNKELMGTVIMTNPGSFHFERSVEWHELPDSNGMLSSTISSGSPDVTMQNIIHVILKGYELAGLDSPNGVVHIRNLSTIREPKAKKVTAAHTAIKEIMLQHHLDISLLEDPTCRTKEGLDQLVQDSRFIILGFVKNMFTEEIMNIMKWKNQYSSKFVCSPLNHSNWCSHPFIWKIHKNYRHLAIENLTDVLNKCQ